MQRTAIGLVTAIGLAVYGAGAYAAYAVSVTPHQGADGVQLVQVKPAEKKVTATKIAEKKTTAKKKKTAKKKAAANKIVAKRTGAKKRRRVRRSFASLTCSIEANKKGLKGSKRKAYSSKCLRAATACSVSATKNKLKGRARTAFRKQCVTVTARKIAG